LIRLRQIVDQYWPVLPAVAVYAYFAHQLDFIQDDAYISYRYVANYLNGDGLVFNIGERVEGFTNFGWVIYMALWGFAREGFILASRVTGFLCGLGIVVLSYRLALVALKEQRRLLAGLVALLVGSNMSLAYWSPAGLETAAFAFFALLSLLLYVKRSYLLIWSMAMAVWLRPEGALVTGLIILLELFEKKSLPRFALKCAAIAFILMLPMVVFKLTYYGSILPNPFYAKTGIRLENLTSGLEYAGRFLKHYGFFGLGLALPLVVWKKIGRGVKVAWLFAAVYTVYIILVGGDVLKVHRFFLPLMGPYALILVGGIAALVSSIDRKTRALIFAVLAVPLIALTIWLPGDFVSTYNRNEKMFLYRMEFMASSIKSADDSDFSVAIPTIGIFGYRLLGHDVIDMVGLTDSTIARHSEEPIEGMSTTWKERKHNSAYLLERDPDYIMFSTGIKPSAPAERALCLYPQFTDSYRTVSWFYVAPGASRAQGSLSSVFKRVRDHQGPYKPVHSVEFIQHYKNALDRYVSGDQRGALKEYQESMQASLDTPYVYLMYQTAFSHLLLGEYEWAQHLCSGVLARDSMVFEAHKDLYMIATLSEDPEARALHERWLVKLVPWYFPKIKADSEANLARFKAALRRQQQSP